MHVKRPKAFAKGFLSPLLIFIGILHLYTHLKPAKAGFPIWLRMNRAAAGYQNAIPYLLSFCTVGRSSVCASPHPSISLLAYKTTFSAPLVRGECSLASLDKAKSVTDGSSCDHPVPTSPTGQQAVNEALLRRLREMQLPSSNGGTASSPSPGNTHSMDNPRQHTQSLRQRRLDLASIPMLSSRGAYLPPSPVHHKPATISTPVPIMDQNTEPSEAPTSSESTTSSPGAVTNSNSSPARSPLPASPTQPADTGWRQILEQARQQQQQLQQHNPHHLPSDTPVHPELTDTFGYVQEIRCLLSSLFAQAFAQQI